MSMTPPLQNFFRDAAGDPRTEEHIQPLFQSAGVRIERIASHGRASEDGFWYDQPTDEWVMLMLGSAVLEYEDAPPVELKKGDWLIIPRHVRHRVASTSSDAIWLAVHAS